MNLFKFKNCEETHRVTSNNKESQMKLATKLSLELIFIIRLTFVE